MIIYEDKIGTPNRKTCFKVDCSTRTPHSAGVLECKDHIRCHCWMASSSSRGDFPQHSGVLAKFLKDTPVFEKEQLGLRFFKRKFFQIFLNFKVLNVLSHVFFQSAAIISLSSPNFATFMTSWAKVDVMVWIFLRVTNMWELMGVSVCIVNYNVNIGLKMLLKPCGPSMGINYG